MLLRELKSPESRRAETRAEAAAHFGEKKILPTAAVHSEEAPLLQKHVFRFLISGLLQLF